MTVSDLIQHIDVSESYAMRTFKDHVYYCRLFKSPSYFTILQLLDRHYKHYEIADKVGFFRVKCLAIILKIFTNVAK